MEKTNIIKTIQSMLQKGESEENILSTLSDLGVNEKQAKSLLQISKADVFTLIQSDIAKSAKESVDSLMPQYIDELKKMIKKETENAKKSVKKEIEENLKKENSLFENKQTNDLNNITQIIENTKEMQEKQEQDIALLDTKIETKTIGSTKGIRIIRIISFIIGIILILVLGFKLFTLGIGSSIDFLLYYIITGSISIVLIIASLL